MTEPRPMSAEKKVWISSFMEPVSVFALLVALADKAGEYPEWALWVVGLPGFVAIFERSVFRGLQVVLTLLLIGFAVVLGSWTLAGFALVQTLLTAIVFLEDEARRDGGGNFLAVLWWCSQAFLHSRPLREATPLDEPGPFPVIFTVVSVYMIAHELAVGLWKLWRGRAIVGEPR